MKGFGRHVDDRYDARPVTPQVLLSDPEVLRGLQHPRLSQRKRSPYEWVDVDDGARVGALLSASRDGSGPATGLRLPDGVSRPGFLETQLSVKALLSSAL